MNCSPVLFIFPKFGHNCSFKGWASHGLLRAHSGANSKCQPWWQVRSHHPLSWNAFVTRSLPPAFLPSSLTTTSQSPLLGAHYLLNQERLDCPGLTPYNQAPGFTSHPYMTSLKCIARPELPLKPTDFLLRCLLESLNFTCSKRKWRLYSFPEKPVLL